MTAAPTRAAAVPTLLCQAVGTSWHTGHTHHSRDNPRDTWHRDLLHSYWGTHGLHLGAEHQQPGTSVIFFSPKWAFPWWFPQGSEQQQGQDSGITLARSEAARGVDTPESMPGQQGGKSLPSILPSSQMRIMLLNCSSTLSRGKAIPGQAGLDEIPGRDQRKCFCRAAGAPDSSSLLETTEQQLDREIPGSPSLPPYQQCSLLLSMAPGTPAPPQSDPA